jgi:FKBP-type peptidyl-prolyl cis-trans isomerase
MSITAVPLHPVKKGAVARLWIGLAVLAALGAGVAVAGTHDQVLMASPDTVLLANAKKPGVMTTASGLQYKILKPATGPMPTDADLVLVDYEGSLADGEVFDSSARNGGPVSLPVEGMIPGFSEGLKLMHQGEKVRFWMKPELGYGAAGAGNGVIPPNALLIFDVELHAIAPRAALGNMGMPTR